MNKLNKLNKLNKIKIKFSKLWNNFKYLKN